MKKVFLSIWISMIALLITGSILGCGMLSDMPFNGDVSFHELNITIPTSYIRDSTQSNDNVWLFEQGNYSKLIILSRAGVSGDVQQALDDYLDLMLERGTNAQKTSFLGLDAVHSTYTQDGLYCQEMLFIYNGSSYAIALRGGTEAEFADLLASATLAELIAEM